MTWIVECWKWRNAIFAHNFWHVSVGWTSARVICRKINSVSKIPKCTGKKNIHHTLSKDAQRFKNRNSLLHYVLVPLQLLNWPCNTFILSHKKVPPWSTISAMALHAQNAILLYQLIRSVKIFLKDPLYPIIRNLIYSQSSGTENM